MRDTKQDKYAKILEYVILDPNISRTKLMQKVNSTHKLLNEYIEYMVEHFYIKEFGRNNWVIYREGLLFLKSYYRLTNH